MGAIKRMDQIHHILKTYQRTRSIKATARETGCARNTIRSYLRLAAEYDKDLQVVLALPDDELRRVFYPGTPAADFDREADFQLHFDAWVVELAKTGVTRQLLWEEYRERVPNGYGYTRWCILFREQAERHNLTLALDHRPSDLLQFDYAGATPTALARGCCAWPKNTAPTASKPPPLTSDRTAGRATDGSSTCSINSSTSLSNRPTCSPPWTTKTSGEPPLTLNLHCTCGRALNSPLGTGGLGANAGCNDYFFNEQYAHHQYFIL